MSHIVAIQSTYQTVQLGLFDGTQCLGESILDKKESSAQLMPSLAALCTAHQWDINRIAYLVTNQGPGPFTTLRTVIASVNGLGFATGIPIIGINALEALIIEFDPDNTLTTLALLNAFGGELYYGLRYAGETDIITGVDLLVNIYGKIQATTLQELHHQLHYCMICIKIRLLSIQNCIMHHSKHSLL
jgi:tRNA threonylcarbamoyladenosine biosynthesis protein TsaB